MLRRVLSERVSAEQFAAAGVAPTARAEELSVEDWGRLAKVVSRGPVGGQATGAPIAGGDAQGAEPS